MESFRSANSKVSIANQVVVGYRDSFVLERFVPLKALYQYMMVPDIDEYKLRIE